MGGRLSMLLSEVNVGDAVGHSLRWSSLLSLFFEIIFNIDLCSSATLTLISWSSRIRVTKVEVVT